MDKAKENCWHTRITRIEKNRIEIAGYPIQEIIGCKDILETSWLLLKGTFPDKSQYEEIEKIAAHASRLPAPEIKRLEGEDISKTIIKYILSDEHLVQYREKGEQEQETLPVFLLGRMIMYLDCVFGNKHAMGRKGTRDSFQERAFSALTGHEPVEEAKVRLLQALIVSTGDHGVTSPSAQAAVISASVRAPYETAMAHGISALTDVHGGAGAKAAEFFTSTIKISKMEGIEISDAIKKLITEYMREGRRIPGLGHRVHTDDPRCHSLWKIAEKLDMCGESYQGSRILSGLFHQIQGIKLPVNVDGVIGAIIADMDLDPRLAKAVFIMGRITGLSAHYFEELKNFKEMRCINFSDAIYRGPKTKRVEI